MGFAQKLAKKIFGSQNKSETLSSQPTILRPRGNMWRRLEGSLSAHNAPSTVTQYMRTLAEFCKAVDIGFGTEEGSFLLKGVTRDDVNDYLNWARTRPSQKGRSALIADTVSLSTVRKKAVILYSIFEHLRHIENIAVNPFKEAIFELRKHKAGNRRGTKMVPFEKVKELLSFKPLDAKEMRDLAIIACLFGGGLRRSEVTGLRMMDIQPQDGNLYLLLRNTKAQTSALQFILPWARSHIERYIEVRKKEGALAKDAVFIAYSGRAASNIAITDSTLYLMFLEWMRKVGLDETYTPHCARATAITLLLERGKTHRTVMKFSRHSSPEMVCHYDKLRTSNSAQEFEDVDL